MQNETPSAPFSLSLDGEWDVPANASLRLGDVALAPEPGLIDIDYAVDGAAPERSHYLRGEPPFRRADRRRSR